MQAFQKCPLDVFPPPVPWVRFLLGRSRHDQTPAEREHLFPECFIWACHGGSHGTSLDHVPTPVVWKNREQGPESRDSSWLGSLSLRVAAERGQLSVCTECGDKWFPLEDRESGRKAGGPFTAQLGMWHCSFCIQRGTGTWAAGRLVLASSVQSSSLPPNSGHQAFPRHPGPSDLLCLPRELPEDREVCEMSLPSRCRRWVCNVDS